MNRILLCILWIPTLLVTSSFVDPIKINVLQEAKNKNIDVYNREMTLIEDDPAHPGIHLSQDIGEGVAWLKGIEFANGTLEFDVKGINIMQHSFVGIAFHGKDNATFDAIYFRPFRFPETDQALKDHQVQFVSLPEHTWRKLRADFPGKYEHAVAPVPDPNSWFHVRVVIRDGTVSTYVNNNPEPSLVVQKLNHNTTGRLGFYVADTSGGDFANITITKNGF